MTATPEQLAEFAPMISTGMEPAEHDEFDTATAEALRRRLGEFDAVRARGEVEGRSFLVL